MTWTAKNDHLTPRRRPSQERSRDRVDRILAATASLLGEMPIDKLTTAAIAARAKVPIGSIYQYFPNKLAILAELARAVMEEIDAKTAELVETDFNVLPWRQAIDRGVDLTMRGYLEQPGYVQLLRGIRPTPEFRAITDASNARAAAIFAAHPAVRDAIEPERIELVTRAAVQAANALQDWALAADDSSFIEQVIDEMKMLLKGYLSMYIDGKAS